MAALLRWRGSTPLEIAPVVERIQRRPPKPKLQVRVLPGALLTNGVCQTMMSDMLKHLEFVDDAVLWRGNQVGFPTSGGEFCLSMSEEDFENGEIPEPERQELRDNREAIVAEIEKRWTITEGRDET